MKLSLPVSPDFLTTIAKLDRFQGQWSARSSVPTDRLPQLEEAARIQSVGASCRMAGIRATDTEVAGVLRGGESTLREAPELRGYAEALMQPVPPTDTLLDSDQVRRLHAMILGSSGSAPEPTSWRMQPLYREAFDAQGVATGNVFSTLPARMVEERTEELLTWLEFELRSGEQHPVLVIGTFLLCFLTVSPFERGNGRIVRLLAGRLLRRAGYDYVPYASLESQMERRRESYHVGLAQGQFRLWTPKANPGPWLEYFLQVLDAHRERIEANVALEREVIDYPPLQRRILETVREHGNVDAALLIKATGANRNTLKDNLRRLVTRGVLEKTGQRRGTRYRLPSANTNPPGIVEALEH
jgi:Fic family protein